MASEDNPANSGLDESNPLYDAVERGKTDPDSTLYEGDDDSGSSGGGGSSDGGASAVDVGSGDSIEDADSETGSSGGGSSSSGGSGGDSASGGTDDPEFSSGDSAVDVGSGDSIEDADSKSADSDPPETGDSGDETLEAAESAGGGTDEPAFSTVEGDPETETVVDNRAVERETARELRVDAISNLNERTGNDGQAFSTEDIELETAIRDDQRVLTAELTESGREKAAAEQERIARDRAFAQLQDQTEETISRDDVDFETDGGTVSAALDTREQPDVTFGQANQAFSRSAQAPAESTGDAPSQIDQDVSRIENLTGFDVPGEGAVIPDVDPAREVEEATGLNLPDSAGSAFVSGVDRAGDVEVPFTDTDIEDAGEFLEPAGEAVEALNVRDDMGAESEADARERLESEGPAASGLRDFGRGIETELAQATSDDPDAVVADRVAESRRQDALEAIQAGPAASPAPAVGRSPAGGINAARGVAGIAGIAGGIAGGSFVVNELDVPSEERDSGELSVPEQGGGFASGEVEVPEDTARSELQPTGAVTDVQEVPVPNQQREFGTLAAQQIVIGQQEPEERREITEEDIVSDRPGRIGRGVNRGPRLEEEREGGVSDLYQPQRPTVGQQDQQTIFERTFPTGAGAVVDGAGTGESARERTEEAQREEARPGETARPQTGQSPISGVASGQQTDVAARQGQQTAQMPGLDLGDQFGQQAAESPGFGAPDGFGPVEATGPGLGTPTANAPGFEQPTVTETTRRPSRRRPPRPRLPGFGGGDSDDEDREFGQAVGEVLTEFRNPLLVQTDGAEDDNVEG